MEHYDVKIAGLERALPLVEVPGGVRIAVLNTLGDTELVQAAAQELGDRLTATDYSVLVTAEAKSLPLIHALSVVTGKPYVVLRKSYRSYMGDAIRAETRSITTGDTQTLLLDAKDKALLDGARVALVDDVISSGSTLDAMRQLVTMAGGCVAVEAAMATEGERSAWTNVIALVHLPVFSNDGR